MLDLVYDARQADIAAGRRSLMIASDNDTVAALNERARAHRVAAGEVHAHGIQAVSGAVIGVGDLGLVAASSLSGHPCRVRMIDK
jgi:hypothetical protein